MIIIMKNEAAFFPAISGSWLLIVVRENEQFFYFVLENNNSTSLDTFIFSYWKETPDDAWGSAQGLSVSIHVHFMWPIPVKLKNKAQISNWSLQVIVWLYLTQKFNEN